MLESSDLFNYMILYNMHVYSKSLAVYVNVVYSFSSLRVRNVDKFLIKNVECTETAQLDVLYNFILLFPDCVMKQASRKEYNNLQQLLLTLI